MVTWVFPTTSGAGSGSSNCRFCFSRLSKESLQQHDEYEHGKEKLLKLTAFSSVPFRFVQQLVNSAFDPSGYFTHHSRLHKLLDYRQSTIDNWRKGDAHHGVTTSDKSVLGILWPPFVARICLMNPPNSPPKKVRFNISNKQIGREDTDEGRGYFPK